MMGKGLLRIMFELGARAAPDVYGALIQGHMTTVYSGSERECYDYIKRTGISATVVGTSEMGEYMVCTGGKK